MALNIPETANKRVVIIGAGFAGLNVINNLNQDYLQIVLLDKHNHHTFQPLLYQVATSGLEASSIAYPIRKIYGNKPNFHYRMAEVESLKLDENEIITTEGELKYDYLVIATGTKTNFFGMADLEKNAMSLKTIEEAIDLRHLILQNIEKHLSSNDELEKEAALNFVLAGGGPTGVEMAGALCELKHKVLPSDYPEIDFSKMNVILVEPGTKVLAAMSETSSKYAEKYLRKLGVDLQFGAGVSSYDGIIATLSNGAKIPTSTLVWAAGVAGNMPEGLDKALVVKGNKIDTDIYSRVKGYDNAFAIGDIAYFPTKKYERGLPSLAPVAIQQGKHCAKNIIRLWNGKVPIAFKYFDKGSLATVGRLKAVGDLPTGGNLHGVIAWFAWLFVHLLYLIGFRNRVNVFVEWVWNYFTWDRRVRLIVRPFNKSNKTTIPVPLESNTLPS
ncbi:MAG: NAD(P)/FAD-dependent oxidoreductase [Bacteroidota bacterium]|nr:NAD(P)/FAD-dependent oxidoreductase [Bacteroidota bacterium]